MQALVFQAIVALLGAQAAPVAQVQRHSAAIAAAVEREPLPFSGPRAKEKSALLLAVVAYKESRFLEAIERCELAPRPGMTQDDGRSLGLWQALEGYGRYGHRREEICGDAELQARLALRYLAQQRRFCGDAERAVGHYNSGRCQVTGYAARVWNRYRRLAGLLGIDR